MQQKIFVLILTVFFLLTACGSEPIAYKQTVLAKPDRIEVTMGSTCITYPDDEEAYTRLFDALSANWWKSVKDTPDVAAPESLQEITTLDEIKTTSDRTYLSADDIVIRFLYDTTQMQWTDSKGRTIDIRLIAFVLPSPTETSSCVRGFFTVSKTDEIGVNEGLFTYYYPHEIENDLWDFLLH